MLSYHPQVDVAQLHAFDHHLAQLPGSWTLERASLLASDPRVICPRWILPDARWGDPAGYLAFLDIAAHRVLLRCFVRQTAQKRWYFEELQVHVGPQLSAQELQEALTFCELQGFVVRDDYSWQAGPSLIGIANFGATFEWIVQEYLHRSYQAVALRCVHFKELRQQNLGDLDVLAFTEHGLSIAVECKSSTTSFSRPHMQRFVQRSLLFPADIALLLVDTQDKQALTSRLAALVDQLPRQENAIQSVCLDEGGSFLYFMQPNIFFASTRGGIQAPIHVAVEVASNAKGMKI